MDFIPTKLLCDGTFLYDIEDFPQTLGEFVNEILKDECKKGRLTIYEPFYIIKYRYGVCQFPEELGNMRITGITACGGWGKMDYTISVEPF